MAYADYEYYVREYLMGKEPVISEDDFLYFEKQAEKEIDLRTFNRIRANQALVTVDVKECACAVAEFLCEAENVIRGAAAQGLAGPLVSWSNDGEAGAIDVSQSCYTESGKKAKIKDLILGTQNCGLFYSRILPIQEMVKLLKGETLGKAYGEEKDPFEEENFYQYYLRVLELKELYSDVKIEGVTPESVNKLIRENGAICNNVRSSNIQLVLNKLVDTLFDVMGLDDGDIYYLNEKIDKLNKILGVDVKTLITIQNLPYLLDPKVTVSMRKDGEDIMWFNFAENIKKLKDFYFISDLVKMIKYHPEVVFTDYNIIDRYTAQNDIYDLFDGKTVDDNFAELVK